MELVKDFDQCKVAAFIAVYRDKGLAAGCRQCAIQTTEFVLRNADPPDYHGA